MANIEFDPIKNAQNIAKHGMSLSHFTQMDFENALYVHDSRKEYGEERWRVMAPIDGRLCIAVYTFRADKFRIISLRKANLKEVKKYDKAQ